MNTGLLINGVFDSLKAEWLYSQGRGRQFQVGEQKALVQYLMETCPLNNQHLETEQERKLRLILSKAQHHQQQLRQEQPRHGKGESVLVFIYFVCVVFTIIFLRIVLVSKFCNLVTSYLNDLFWPPFFILYI